MSELGETFRVLKERSQQRRALNRESSPKLLEAAGIPFEEKNWGAHLIVQGPNSLVDFWPGTGRWVDRGGSRGFGVRKLIKHLKGENHANSARR